MIFCIMPVISLILISSNPYFLIVSLLLTTLYSMYLINILLTTMWFSMLVLIIIIGGLLVLFLYLISLIPKDKMNLSMKFPLLMMFISVFILFDMSTIDLKIFNPQTMYQYPMIMSFSIMFLLMALFTSTQLTNLKAGPLRLL